MTQGLRLEVTHGVCSQGKLHYSLDGSVTALCGATMDAESCTRHESMLLPGSPDSNVCRECAGKVAERTIAAADPGCRKSAAIDQADELRRRIPWSTIEPLLCKHAGGDAQ